MSFIYIIHCKGYHRVVALLISRLITDEGLMVNCQRMISMGSFNGPIKTFA